MNFTNWLEQKRYRPGTIKAYRRHRDYYLAWAEKSGREAEKITYADLLDFIKHCRRKGQKKAYINQLLGVVRHYYDYLKHSEKISVNPATGLYIRGRLRRLPHDLLTAEQLDTIYTGYREGGITGSRNKAMLGLFVYQGITPFELHHLEPGHLQLKSGKIEIPPTTRSRSRMLNLEARQMIELQEYVSITRVKILSETGKKTTKLFTSLGSGHRIHTIISKLREQLGRQHHFFTGTAQLRQSRIAIWTRQYDIRQAQYLAGHKYVSSTERYRQEDLEELTGQLEKYHPLK
jgi:integrase/recombinase XerD